MREMKVKIIELEEMIRSHSITRTELQRIIDDRNMEITVLNEGITRQVCTYIHVAIYIYTCTYYCV